MNVYDFDHTIYDGDSSVDFYRFVLCRRPYLIVLLPFQVFGMTLFLFGIFSKERMKESFFIFIHYIPLQKMVFSFWEINRGKIKSWYLRQKQDSDAIVSASPEFLLEPLVCRYLGVTLIASRIDPGTCKFIGKNCLGGEKVTRLYAAYPNGIIENFYSDSLSDVPLAEKAQQSFIIKGHNIVPWDNYRITVFEKIKNLYFTKDFILFIFCGGMGTLTNFIISLLFSIILNPVISYVCGYGIGTYVSYTLNTKLVIHQKISFIGFAKFVISYLPNFSILFTFVFVFINLLHWDKLFVYALAGLLGLPITFLLVKLMFLTNKEKE